MAIMKHAAIGGMAVGILTWGLCVSGLGQDVPSHVVEVALPGIGVVPYGAAVGVPRVYVYRPRRAARWYRRGYVPPVRVLPVPGGFSPYPYSLWAIPSPGYLTMPGYLRIDVGPGVDTYRRPVLSPADPMPTPADRSTRPRQPTPAPQLNAQHPEAIPAPRPQSPTPEL